MSYSASNIIQINTHLRAQGLTFGNFGSTMLFTNPAENPLGTTPDTFKTYGNLTELGLDFAPETETYKAGERFLGATPRPRELTVYFRDETDTSWSQTLNKARNLRWWYCTLVTAQSYSVVEDVLQIASWCESNESLFVNNVTGEMATAVRDENSTDDICSQLTALGYRMTYSAVHATDAYAGNALWAHFAKVNYLGDNTTITGEFKKSPGVASESLPTTEYTAMNLPTKKATYYTFVDLQGSVDAGRWLNTWSHSTYGEYIDDVVNLSAFINHVNVSLYNALANQPTKLPQTTIGQQVLTSSLRASCQQYIDNGYLGERNYVNPDTGLEEYTAGFEILSVPEDILSISESERNGRWSAPLKIRIFRAGAIHKAIVDIEVY